MSCKTEKIKVTVGNQVFFADIYKNDVSNNILKQLPMTVRMEKENSSYFVPLNKRIGGKAESVSQVVNGDIAICNSISVSIFTEAMHVGSSFVSIGHINNPEGLSQELMNSNGVVTFDVDTATLAASA